jgi:hypothetical protein
LYFSRGDAAPNPQTPTVFGRSSEWCGGETGPGEGGAADSACGSAIFGVLGGNWVGKSAKITEIGGWGGEVCIFRKKIVQNYKNEKKQNEKNIIKKRSSIGCRFSVSFFARKRRKMK